MTNEKQSILEISGHYLSQSATLGVPQNYHYRLDLTNSNIATSGSSWADDDFDLPTARKRSPFPISPLYLTTLRSRRA